MRKLLCRIFGHDREPNGGTRRTCLRCGLQETLRNLGNVRGWEEVTPPARGASKT